MRKYVSTELHALETVSVGAVGQGTALPQSRPTNLPRNSDNGVCWALGPQHRLSKVLMLGTEQKWSVGQLVPYPRTGIQCWTRQAWCKHEQLNFPNQEPLPDRRERVPSSFWSGSARPQHSGPGGVGSREWGRGRGKGGVEPGHVPWPPAVTSHCP